MNQYYIEHYVHEDKSSDSQGFYNKRVGEHSLFK